MARKQNPKTITSIRKLATALAKSHPAVSGWLRHPDWPFPRKGPWKVSDIPRMKKWAVDTLRPDRAEGETDPLLVGGNSPALERYRAARASLAELELSKQRAALVEVATVRAMLEPFPRLIRLAGEKLRNAYGNEAAAILNEAIDDAEAQAVAIVARLESGEGRAD